MSEDLPVPKPVRLLSREAEEWFRTSIEELAGGTYPRQLSRRVDDPDRLTTQCIEDNNLIREIRNFRKRF